MKINEVTNNERLDELWPQVIAGATALGKLGSKLFKKSPNKSKITKTNRAEFDNIPLSKKVTGKVHGDPKLGSTRDWKKQSNLDLQKKLDDIRKGNK